MRKPCKKCSERRAAIARAGKIIIKKIVKGKSK